MEDRRDFWAFFWASSLAAVLGNLITAYTTVMLTEIQKHLFLSNFDAGLLSMAPMLLSAPAMLCASPLVDEYGLSKTVLASALAV